MKYFYRIIGLSLVCMVLTSCAINYSPVILSQTGVTKAHVASGSSLYIDKVNGVGVAEPLMAHVPGRELIIPSGLVSLHLEFRIGNVRGEHVIKHNFSADNYYIIVANPDYKSMKVGYDIRQVSVDDFRKFQCDVQRKINEGHLAGINPQKTPACDE